MTARPPLPEWLLGDWRREWIERAGVRRQPHSVDYLQAQSAFGDLRLPQPRELIRARNFNELSDTELRQLTEQRGFAGFTTLRGDCVEWHHELDYQPCLEPELDEGRVACQGAQMMEFALDGSYSECWWRVAGSDGRQLVLDQRKDGRLEQLFILVGDRFFYARNRAVELPRAASFSALLAETSPSRATLIAYLDCELAVGRARGGSEPWQIERSTLPWREGVSFSPPLRCVGLETTLEPGWVQRENSLLAPELELLFGGSPLDSER
jgi:hypothetical protein